MLIIRTESRKDFSVIRRINQLTFGRHNEADLVDALRQSAHPHISLVAILNSQVVGHIFFSPVSIESGSESFTALGLAPMSVLPEYQNQGIGTALVQEGLKECQKAGYEIVVVLGHPEYYPRFGFSVASRKGLKCEYDVADEVFMVAELKQGALDGREGIVKYHPAFKEV